MAGSSAKLDLTSRPRCPSRRQCSHIPAVVRKRGSPGYRRRNLSRDVPAAGWRCQQWTLVKDAQQTEASANSSLRIPAKCVPTADTSHRFERVSCCQLVGFINQTHFLKPASRKTEGGASAAPKPEYGRWIWAHNPERYAYDNYGKALRSLVDGTPFQNTNIPPGYNYKPWTLHELYERIDKGENVDFEGDWS